MLGFDVAAAILFQAEGVDDGLFRTEEAHRQQHQLSGQPLLRTGNVLRREATVFVLHPLDLDGMDGGDLTVLVALKMGRRSGVSAGILTEHGGGFFLAVVHAVDLGPLRPWVVGGAGFGRLGHDFQLGDAGAAVADGGAHAVGTRVAAADDHDILACGGDVVHAGGAVQHCLGVGGEELHGEVDALEVAPFDGQVAGTGGARAEDHRVKVVDQRCGGEVFANFGVADEGDALGFQHIQAAHDDLLLVQLHVGDAVHEQTTGAIAPLIHRHPMSGGVELGGSGQPRRPGTDDRHLLPGALARRRGRNPARFPALFSNGILDVFDGDGGLNDAQHAGPFAGGGADPSGEFGEVVGFVEAIERILPASPVDQVVPLGDQVVDGATAGGAVHFHACVAEGGAAVHAARALGLQVFLGHVEVKFIPVANAIGGGDFIRHLAQKFHKASWFSHDVSCDYSLVVDEKDSEG